MSAGTAALTVTLALAVLPLGAPVAIEGVRVEVGDGSTIPEATVLIDGGKIVAVGSARLPADAVHIDGRGKVLTPGFVESVTQLGLIEIAGEPAARDDTVDGRPLTPALRAADGFNWASARIPINREEGITSAVTSPRGALLYGTGYWFELTGTAAARPDRQRPVAMFAGVGEPAARALGGARGNVWLRLREVVQETRLLAASRKAFDRRQLRPLSLSPMHLEAMTPVVQGRLPLVLRAERASDILTALAFATAQGIRLVISGACEGWRVADALAEAKVPVILKPSDQFPSSFEALAARDDAAVRLWRAGVRLVLSAGIGDMNIRRLRQQAGIAVAEGLPHAEAIKAITLAPAEVFGKAQDLGSVATGKRANLVLWSGDPLELHTVADRIWIDGVEMSRDNRQRRLVQRYLRQ